MRRTLDDLSSLRRYDSQDMLAKIGRTHQNARETIHDSMNTKLEGLVDRKFKALLIAGMGGSAVGGLLLRDWLVNTCGIPIIVSQGYHLPAWVEEDTLVYIVSYSGNTEETLTQFKEAIERGSSIVCFSSGGKLSKEASINGVPLISFPKNYQPRAAIAFQFFSLATVTKRLGFIDDKTWAEVDESIKVIETITEMMRPETPTEKNPGKELAERIKGHIPFIYGGGLYTGVAYRFCCQFNENSKSPAASSFFPEAFHNSVMALEADIRLLEKLCLIIIRDVQDEEKMQSRTTRFKRLFSDRGCPTFEVKVKGKSRLARMLSALIIGDYTSVYLGLLYGHDPSSTDSITLLKQVK